jgi:DNA-binding response OmpR family regulator
LRGPATEVSLDGRRVVVADDDPAVVWFLADLLKAQGCIVHEAFDGRRALELAYRTSPDLILCDIVMPEVDGFTLCRTLRRDAALHDVPVVLLSWKEDLLQRTRELGAGAAGYLRKESDARAILARLREALRPRAHIEMRMRDVGEVRGRIDGLSVRTLLEIVCSTRPDARVTVRDATFNYEFEIREGSPKRATRTTGDGTFLEGERALAAAVGTMAGRFSVNTTAARVEPQFDGNLQALLTIPIASARAASGLLTGALAIHANLVVLDDDLLDDYLRAMPEQARTIAMRIAKGATPRALVLEGAAAASLVEDIVFDLASRGIVRAIEDDMGSDLLGPEVARLAELGDMRASRRMRKDTCTSADESELCESPVPVAVQRAATPSGHSLEEAVLGEIAFRSPTPRPLGLPEGKPMLIETSTLKARTSPHPPHVRNDDDDDDDDSGTPSPDEIIALAEPTIVDDTLYEERIRSRRQLDATQDDSVSLPPDERVERAEPTVITTRRQASDLEAPRKQRLWPMLAFVLLMGAVAWAIFHFAGALLEPARTNEVPVAPAK